jgi:hypothetical protein
MQENNKQTYFSDVPKQFDDFCENISIAKEGGGIIGE